MLFFNQAQISEIMIFFCMFLGKTVCNMVTKFLADTPNGPSIIFKVPHVFPQMICRLLDSSNLYIRHSNFLDEVCMSPCVFSTGLKARQGSCLLK